MKPPHAWTWRLAVIGLVPEGTAAYIEAAQQATVLAMPVLYVMLSPP